MIFCIDINAYYEYFHKNTDGEYNKAYVISSVFILEKIEVLLMKSYAVDLQTLYAS